MNSNARFVARLSILSFLLSLEDELTHYASCVEKNRLAALWGGWWDFVLVVGDFDARCWCFGWVGWLVGFCIGRW